MKEYGIVDSGDAATLRIGAMTDARMKNFYDKLVAAGVCRPSIAPAKAYTLQFVNKKAGVVLRPKCPFCDSPCARCSVLPSACCSRLRLRPNPPPRARLG